MHEQKSDIIIDIYLTSFYHWTILNTVNFPTQLSLATTSSATSFGQILLAKKHYSFKFDKSILEIFYVAHA